MKIPDVRKDMAEKVNPFVFYFDTKESDLKLQGNPRIEYAREFGIVDSNPKNRQESYRILADHDFEKNLPLLCHAAIKDPSSVVRDYLLNLIRSQSNASIESKFCELIMSNPKSEIRSFAFKVVKDSKSANVRSMLDHLVFKAPSGSSEVQEAFILIKKDLTLDNIIDLSFNSRSRALATVARDLFVERVNQTEAALKGAISTQNLQLLSEKGFSHSDESFTSATVTALYYQGDSTINRTIEDRVYPGGSRVDRMLFAQVLSLVKKNQTAGSEILVKAISDPSFRVHGKILELGTIPGGEALFDRYTKELEKYYLYSGNKRLRDMTIEILCKSESPAAKSVIATASNIWIRDKEALDAFRKVLHYLGPKELCEAIGIETLLTLYKDPNYSHLKQTVIEILKGVESLSGVRSLGEILYSEIYGKKNRIPDERIIASIESYAKGSDVRSTLVLKKLFGKKAAVEQLDEMSIPGIREKISFSDKQRIKFASCYAKMLKGTENLPTIEDLCKGLKKTNSPKWANILLTILLATKTEEAHKLILGTTEEIWKSALKTKSLSKVLVLEEILKTLCDEKSSPIASNSDWLTLLRRILSSNLIFQKEELRKNPEMRLFWEGEILNRIIKQKSFDEESLSEMYKALENANNPFTVYFIYSVLAEQRRSDITERLKKYSLDGWTNKFLQIAYNFITRNKPSGKGKQIAELLNADYLEDLRCEPKAIVTTHSYTTHCIYSGDHSVSYETVSYYTPERQQRERKQWDW